MTAQIVDTVTYEERTYQLSRWRGGQLFLPETYDLPVVMASTISWRGYVCSYVVQDRTLKLSTLEAKVGRYDDDDLLVAVTPPVINGKQGLPGEPPFNTIYKELDLHIHFTGQMLIGREVIEELVNSSGLAAPWDFRTTLSLCFDAGALTSEEDVSAEMESLRAQLTENQESAPHLARDDLAWLVKGEE
ncbi:MAG TPA: hypothetical protein VFB70_00680 [Pyrinomonadaceae bacterium]|jgi:hypothetical protein|nr:hypothetical protein [Pyrinomonadaceae bacterium]